MKTSTLFPIAFLFFLFCYPADGHTNAPEKVPPAKMSGSSAKTAKVPPATTMLFTKRINCGTAANATYNGATFTGDAATAGVSFTGEKTGSFNINVDPAIKSMRYTKNSNREMFYEINVPQAGDYRVKMYFAEPYWGVSSGGSGVGVRVFDVLAQGNMVANNLDVVGQVGAHAVHTVETTVTVASGDNNRITLEFDAEPGKNDPIVSAIEVVEVDTGTPPPTPDFDKKINCGSTSNATYGGDTFIGDQSGSITGVSFTGELKRTFNINVDPAIKSMRYTKNTNREMFYEINVPQAGDYKVKMYFAEPYWGVSSGGSGVGVRVFDVLAQGNMVANNLDVIGQVGPHAVYTLETTVTVASGDNNKITLEFDAEPGKNDPIVSAIHITEDDGGTPPPPPPTSNSLVFVFDAAGNQTARRPPTTANKGAGLAKEEAVEEAPVAEAEPEAEADPFEQSIAIYPNPTRGELTMVWDGGYSHLIQDIHVSDMAGGSVPVDYGQTRLNESFGQGGRQAQVDLARHPAGVYLVTFYLTDGRTLIKKIIKQ